MSKDISVIINTLNEEKNIARAIESVKWADEVVVCDMHSEDKTVEIAKKLGAKVISHKRLDYVEPARNFAISKASNEWILIADPDEEIPDQLAKRLKEIANKMEQIDYVRIPRKNIIFGKWMKGAMWWPDLNVRFFRQDKVKWTDKIHRPPELLGQGLDLPAEEKWAIIHHNYQTIGQFIERMNRYTTIEAEELKKQGYEFNWQDLFDKPLNEFLSRFFANRGFEDGLHGLALSLLQGFSFLIIYLKVWENSSFKEAALNLADLEADKSKMGYQINYWMKEIKSSKNPFKRFFSKFKVYFFE
ncbi:glycosyltransferase family 2 protein [Candidatus Daviesbacteria bacterium]|nr:glycosyltransferase family 2 protein [Candidatus Daviesbacteria bacterium]